ncbi:MAG: hypothetical protein NTX63_02285 [Candidatus Peregrinibacteria bacterium]|nr:hypothetical protein [Candidatus Peregrinibacteria bacterium]
MENQTFTTGATVAPANNQPTVGAPNPFKKAIWALATILVVGGVGASVYLNMGPAPAKGDPNEPPPSLTAAGGGLKGQFTETQQGFLQYEAKDLVAFDAIKSSLASKFGAPGAVKGNAVVNYMTVNMDGMTMADFVNNYNPKADGNRALFLIYSAGQNGLSKGFHTYPAGPFGTATTEIKKDDLAKISLARNSGVIMISKLDSESNGVLDPSVAPTLSSFPTPLLADDQSGWILVSGNGKLADLLGTNKDRVISAWALKDPTTFEKVDMSTYAFSTYHVAWLNLLPKSAVTNPTQTAVAPKITSITPATAVQGQKAVAFTITGTDLEHPLCTGVGTTTCLYSTKVDFNPAADFQNVTGLVADATGTTVKFIADIADTATADFKEIKVTTLDGSVTDKSFKVTAKAVVNPLIGQTVLAHYNFPGTLATVQWFEAKITAVTNNRYSYTFVNKIVSSIDGKAFDIDSTVTPGASVVDDFETNIAVPADAPYLEGEKDLFVIVKYKTTGGYWNARLNGKNADGTYAITYLNDKNTDTVPLSKVYKPLGAKIHLEAEVAANKAGSPTITSLSVRSGVSGELAEFDISGTNLDKVTTLSLGGLEVGGTPLSNLTATKAHAKFIINTSIPVGPQDLVVTNPSGSAKFAFTVKENTPLVVTPGLGNTFNFLLAPTIKTLSVKEGVRGDLAKIDITGTNLNNVGMLSIGGIDAAGNPLSQTATTAHYEFWININTPLGDQNLVVTNPFGSAKTTFTVKAPAAPSVVDKAVGTTVLVSNGGLSGACLFDTLFGGTTCKDVNMSGSNLMQWVKAKVTKVEGDYYTLQMLEGPLSGKELKLGVGEYIAEMKTPSSLKQYQKVIAKGRTDANIFFSAHILAVAKVPFVGTTVYTYGYDDELVNGKYVADGKVVTPITTIDNFFVPLGGEVIGTKSDVGDVVVAAVTPTLSDVDKDLANLGVILDKTYDPTTGNLYHTFRVSTEKLGDPALYGVNGKTVDVSIEVDGKGVIPTSNGMSSGTVADELKLYDNGAFQTNAGKRIPGIYWGFEAKATNMISSAVKLPVKPIEWYTNGTTPKPYDDSFMSIPGTDKSVHTFKFTFTDVETKATVKEYTTTSQIGNAHLRIEPSFGDKVAFGYSYCNAGCGNQVFTGPAGNDSIATAYQVVKIYNDVLNNPADPDGAVPANTAADYVIQLDGDYVTSAAKVVPTADPLLKISGGDIAKYGVAYYDYALKMQVPAPTNFPAPGKSITLFIPTTAMTKNVDYGNSNATGYGKPNMLSIWKKGVLTPLASYKK